MSNSSDIEAKKRLHKDIAASDDAHKLMASCIADPTRGMLSRSSSAQSGSPFDGGSRFYFSSTDESHKYEEESNAAGLVIDASSIDPERTLDYISLVLKYDYRQRDLRTLLHDGSICCRILDHHQARLGVVSCEAPEYAQLSRKQNYSTFLITSHQLQLISEQAMLSYLEKLEDFFDIAVVVINTLMDIAGVTIREETSDKANNSGHSHELSYTLPLTQYWNRSAASHNQNDPRLATRRETPASYQHLPSRRPKSAGTHEMSPLVHSKENLLRRISVQPVQAILQRQNIMGDTRPGLARSQSVRTPGTRSTLELHNEVAALRLEAPMDSLQHEAITMTDGVVFLLGDVLGRGQFGTVYRAMNASTGRIVAIKRIPVSNKPRNEVDQMMQEVRLLRSLSSPYVVKYEGYCTNDSYVSIVVEYVENGSLQNTIRTFGCFNEQLSAGYTVKILQGLIYLHSEDVVHCDVKCANVLTTKRGEVKLSDFGISLHLSGQSTIKGLGVSGTPNWLAPEVISMRGTSKASDIWALGCTVLEMVTGKPPYNGQNAMNTMYSIVEDQHPPLPTSISTTLRKFLLLCFQKEPRLRPTAAELMLHAWLRQFWKPKSSVSDSDSQSLLLGNFDYGDTEISVDMENVIPRGFEQQKSALIGISSQTSGTQLVLRGLGPRPSSTPLVITKRQSGELSIEKSLHLHVQMTFPSKKHCAVCSEIVRRGLWCQRCATATHQECSMRQITPCMRPQKSVSRLTENTKQQALEHGRSKWIHFRKPWHSDRPRYADQVESLALLPARPVAHKRKSLDAKASDCRMM